MMEIIISFVTGILLTLGGVWLTNYFQKRREQEKEKEKIRFEIYMNLLDIQTYYFWVVSDESHGYETDKEITNLLRKISLKTSDKLRQVDTIEHLEDILDILFNQKFEKASERAKKLDELMHKLHRIVSPRFMKKMKSITADNQKVMMTRSLKSLNAPATSKI